MKDDPGTTSTPEQHADDVHRIIEAVGGGPVDLFASSGGAVNALALVAAHPGDVRTLIAHEPPLAALVPDREAALAVSRAVADAYRAGGFGPGMARFIGVRQPPGPVHGDGRRGARPRPGAVRPADRGRRRPDRPAPVPEHRLEHALRAGLRGAARGPDADRHRGRRRVGGPARVPGGIAAAERLGSEAVRFPSDHGGFLGGEYGQTGDPDAFAARLRDVLAEA